MQSNIVFILGLLCVTGALCQGANRCEDVDQNCVRWRTQGLCSSEAEQMRRLCASSCGLCGQPTVPLPSIVNPDFQCGKPYTTVESNTGFRRARRQTPTSQKPETTGVPAVGIDELAETTPKELEVQDTICGASVIHPRYIVTAAHCVLDPTQSISSVRLGELDFSSDNETNSRPVDYIIDNIIVNHGYDPQNIRRYNNIALLKTRIPIEFNSVVFPLCVSDTRPSTGSNATASGFGKVNSTSHSSVLQEAELTIVDTKECEAAYSEANLTETLKKWYPDLLVGKDVLCAGHPEREACEGDSGGPLFVDHNGQRNLVGVVSITLGCQDSGPSGLPGIYVNIADHIDFINAVIYGV